MPKPTLHLSSAEDVEQQFYDALNHGDLELLMACWTDEEEVVCIPPGGELLTGLTAVRELFAALFANGPVRVAVLETHRMDHLAYAVHTVVEEVQVSSDQGPAAAEVFATNVFVKTSRGWRIQVHHATPGRIRLSQAQTAGQPAPPTTIH
ncbi:MAG: hypothetical protein RL357_860 [Pseudomonadota bacterium]|jgi:uncharacterized protein (TIGR02246 family)